MTIELPGWSCPKCKAFNGDAKERLSKCRACDAQRPKAIRLVLLETPFKGLGEYGLRYARFCMRDCFSRGEAPFASHLLYPQCLDDNIEAERTLGLQSGWEWGLKAEASVVYTDLGISTGMKLGIEAAKQVGRVVEMRKLAGWESTHRLETAK